jgi:hypothetical protein
MKANARIRNALYGLFKSFGFSKDAFSAEVLSVDVDTRTCSVLSISSETETQYDSVWLMPEVQDGMLYLPKVGSTVIVDNNANLEPYVVMYSAIDEILYIVNSTTFKMTSGLTQFNKGLNAGLVNVKPLVAKINALENVINSLKTAVTAVVIAGSTADGGAVKAGILAGLGSGITPTTVQADLEDTAVTH